MLSGVFLDSLEGFSCIHVVAKQEIVPFIIAYKLKNDCVPKDQLPLRGQFDVLCEACED